MAAVRKSKDVIESVRMSADERALLVSLVDQDPEVVAFAKSGGLGADPAEAVEAAKRIFKVGVLSAASGAGQATISELHRVLAQMDAIAAMPQQVAEQLATTIGHELKRMTGDDERPGALSAALDEVTAEAAEILTAAVQPIQEALLGSGPKALPQLLESRLLRAMSRGTQQALDRVFDDGGASPLMILLNKNEKAVADLRKENTAISARMQRQIAELAEKVVAQQAQTPAPAKRGNTWERDVLDDLARITAILGDRVEAVGSTAGHGRQLVGDHILHVYDEDYEGIRVAIECRTGDKQLTLAQMRRAVENREAHGGLLLSESATALPGDARALGFRIYRTERVVALRYDRTSPEAEHSLAIAVQIARLLARLEASAGGELADREQIRDGIGRIEGAMTHLRPLRAAVTGIEKETAAVRRHAAELEAELRRALSDLSATITAS